MNWFFHKVYWTGWIDAQPAEAALDQGVVPRRGCGWAWPPPLSLARPLALPTDRKRIVSVAETVRDVHAQHAPPEKRQPESHTRVDLRAIG
jgi:hypothetical protein